MSEEKKDGMDQSPEQSGDSTEKSTKPTLKSILIQLVDFIKDVLDISSDTEKPETMELIRKDISFKGHTAWILVCSIMIASVGLNNNSNPVIIGAMLISPLMGPILGIGMAIAIHDIDTLKRSLINFMIMVFLSVFTAFIFFYFFPLKNESSELLARTSPDFRDVLIAFFGGLALIIARTKRGAIASVIFGVAIATALMPPLCTAGYGLAEGNFVHFIGAMYLFTINTIYIALATYIVLKLLNFPMERYTDSLRRKRIDQAVSIISFLIMIPALYTFYNVFQESLFMRQAEKFVKTEIESFVIRDGKFVPKLTQYNYNDEGESSISLVFLGEEVVTDEIEQTWINKLKSDKYNQLQNTRLNIVQGTKDEIAETAVYIEKLYEDASEELVAREEEIEDLQAELNLLRKNQLDNIPFQTILQETISLFPDLSSMTYNTRLTGSKSDIDTSLVFNTSWENYVKEEEIKRANERLTSWLKTRLSKNNILVTSQ